MNEDVINILKNFAEGKVSVDEFEKILYSDPKLEEFLSHIYPDHYEREKSNVYLRLLALDFNSQNGIYKAREYIESIINNLGISFKISEEENQSRDDKKLLDECWPKYVGYINDEMLIQNVLTKIIPRIRSAKLSKSEEKKMLKEELKKLFAFDKKAPSSQDIDWPVQEGTPLFFIGELKASSYSFCEHDTIFYVFFNFQTCEPVTIFFQG